MRRTLPGVQLLVRALTAIVCTGVCATSARAQAWTPPAGVGAVTIAVQTINNNGHRLTDGSMLRGYDSRSTTVTADLDYAITDRFSVSATVPYVFAKYTGPELSFSGLPVDECHCWNRGFQDLGFTARYRLTSGAVAVTPSVSFGVPSHDYDFFGEAVLGRNLTEWRFAVDVGRRLDAISPRLSVSGRYAYSVVERVLALKNDRSNFNVETAYLFTSRLSGRMGLSWQKTHGGLTSPEFDTDEKFLQFDRLIRDNNWKLGGGVSYSLARVDVFGAWLRYMGGTDTHAGYAITGGISVPFELPIR